jgi:hypothetical protein
VVSRPRTVRDTRPDVEGSRGAGCETERARTHNEPARRRVSADDARRPSQIEAEAGGRDVEHDRAPAAVPDVDDLRPSGGDCRSGRPDGQPERRGRGGRAGREQRREGGEDERRDYAPNRHRPITVNVTVAV